MVAGQVLWHLQSTAKVPLSKVLNPPKCWECLSGTPYSLCHLSPCGINKSFFFLKNEKQGTVINRKRETKNLKKQRNREDREACFGLGLKCCYLLQPKNTRLDGMYFHRKVQRCLFLLLLFTEINVDVCFEVRQHPAGDRIKQDKRWLMWAEKHFLHYVNMLQWIWTCHG